MVTMSSLKRCLSTTSTQKSNLIFLPLHDMTFSHCVCHADFVQELRTNI
jgi:hypothetical protein